MVSIAMNHGLGLREQNTRGGLDLHKVGSTCMDLFQSQLDQKA